MVGGSFRSCPVMRAALAVLALIGLLAPLATAQQQQHEHHAQPQAPAAAHSAGHAHDVGPAGRTYDLRWIDAMVQHHTGALRMSEVVFICGTTGVGALDREIWRDQAQEI